MNPLKVSGVLLAIAGAFTVATAQQTAVTNRNDNPSQKVREARFSADGRQIVTSSADNTVRVWDLKTGKLLLGTAAHLGTWQLVSFKYGENGTWTDAPQGQRRLKLLTPTHFTWVAYDLATGKVQSMAGGTYTLKDSAYTELIEFAGEGMTNYLGKKQQFTLKVEGDKWTQSGELSDGTKVEEVWRRVR